MNFPPDFELTKLNEKIGMIDLNALTEPTDLEAMDHSIDNCMTVMSDQIDIEMDDMTEITDITD